VRGISRTAPAHTNQAKALRSDLDWIVMRCLEKDRTRRYQTAEALADDLARYQSNQPVEARRPTGWYRLKKFIRRNKVGVLVGTAVVAALSVGLLLASIGMLEARRESDRNRDLANFLADLLRSAHLTQEADLAAIDKLFSDDFLQAGGDKSGYAGIMRTRATLNARVGRWTEAVADCLKANSLSVDGRGYSFDCAIVLLKTGHTDDYRRVCHAYLERVAADREFISADMAAKVSLLLPVDGADFERACQLADFAATETEPEWHVACVRLGKALADYRRRRFESARDWAQRAIASEGITPRQKSAAFFILAASSASLDDHASAESALDRGEDLIKTDRDAFSHVFGDTWCDWTIADILRSEAAAVISKTASTGLAQPPARD